MKIIKVLIRIRDCRSWNRSTFSPMKVGDIVLGFIFNPLETEEIDLMGNLPTHDACLSLFDEVSN